jgi:hypothetical protein
LAELESANYVKTIIDVFEKTYDLGKEKEKLNQISKQF